MERLKISSKNLNLVINKVIKVIKKGGVIVCPTDTVYGLIADATNEKAVKKVFQIKKRTFQKPIPVFVKDLKMAKQLARINKIQEKFLTPHQNKFGTGQEKVWPGKVTVVLKAKTKKLPKGIISKDKKIGLRIPNYKVINKLLMIINHPLTGTSANISGKPESTKIKEVIKQFQNHPPTKFGEGQPDLILVAGNLKTSLPSTVIDLTNFQILREGAISKDEIFKILGKIK